MREFFCFVVCRVVPFPALFWFFGVAERKRLLYEKFFSPRGQRELEVSFALTQAGVTVQTAVCHLKSRIGAGAKKIFASAAPKKQKVAQKNVKSLIKEKEVMNFQ
jgi:hypothetical protein